MYALSGLVMNFIQSLAGFFKEPGEDFSPGVWKISQKNGPTSYIFSSELVGEMTSERYLCQLGENGFCEKYHLAATMIEGSKTIRFDGAGGFICDLPRIVFSKDEARLIVPYSLWGSSLWGSRDWDQIARAMRAIFDKSRVS